MNTAITQTMDIARRVHWTRDIFAIFTRRRRVDRNEKWALCAQWTAPDGWRVLFSDGLLQCFCARLSANSASNKNKHERWLRLRQCVRPAGNRSGEVSRWSRTCSTAKYRAAGGFAKTWRRCWTRLHNYGSYIVWNRILIANDHISKRRYLKHVYWRFEMCCSMHAWVDEASGERVCLCAVTCASSGNFHCTETGSTVLHITYTRLFVCIALECACRQMITVNVIHTISTNQYWNNLLLDATCDC